MRQFLTTLRRDGYFDFYSNLIEIEKYDARSKFDLQKILKGRPESLAEYWQAEAMSLFIHEYTHFLDITSTAWGLEFLLRKNNVSKSLGNPEAIEKYSPVFMLNLAEIDVHTKLLKIYSDKELIACKTEHSAIYSEDYGSIIVVYFSDNNKKVIETPLSMLSVLESNAYASEILTKIRYLEAKGSADDMIFLEVEVNHYLNSAMFSEYSLLIILCRKHFEYLSLKECLIFFQALVSRVLNMSQINLSIISSFLKYTFKNKYVGNAICKDIQRGMSRQVVIFKLILMLHQFINEYENKVDLIKLMKTSPNKLLSIFFNDNSISIQDSLDFGDFTEFTILLNIAAKDYLMPEHKILTESANHNHEVLKRANWGKLSLSDFRLIDCFLSDGGVISAPTRIDFNVEDYFERNLDSLVQLEGVYKTAQVTKFHIHPNDVSYV
ncbi:hypothetical protein [Nitrosomonas oligotropha]|uniref:hypothetical protein n=1 Tax=Nitrosomonas oligotropha TaxID=42354 RepID=UPI0013699759|nr:hypothetical protein [Nitrosomonas oligotropha]MXS84131.1 hypothetical protein [Nitrosomonas oligotropha]